ncbi:malonyl-CoA O-methyltransferase [Chitinivorax tropicus]|uniref:Malonyl-[acyl-carrier protein] O-methyltransferase n=1 Tax=Chitinivorax tropicus TaxID=714531 RepID=A0A840MNV7_9PROT|nr:malonyl-ACP O-methyltransferase BioC [Chitinivorax tropicus]MBB5018186.1 malonyl-CoA O-methyltransferase [Chitinivorax tropicus]
MAEDFYTDKRQVRRSFERAAHSYDAAAVLQREVSDRMQARLGYIKHAPATVLDVGAGTGYGARQLRTQYPAARVIELDLALAMLQFGEPEKAWWKKHLPFARSPSRAPQVCADAEAIPLADGSVDMVWSNLTLQWCNAPDRAFADIHRVLRPDGLLMFSTLGPDTLKELRQAFAGIDGHTHVNRFIDMHDLGDALVRAGFAEPVMDMEIITMTYDSVKAVMQDLKGIGAHNVTQGRQMGLMGKRKWQQVLDRYEKLRRDGRLPATYEVVYGHAWRAADKPSRLLADGRQVIEFRPRPGK